MLTFVRQFATLGTLVLVLAPTALAASDAFWFFAHRVNTPEVVRLAADDHEVNAIEIDVSHWDDISSSRRDNCKQQEVWCAYHSGDPNAESLSSVLDEANSHIKLGAVWLDVKSTDKTRKDYDTLSKIVRDSLGTGRGNARKFWGIWPPSVLEGTYGTWLIDELDTLGGNNENVPIIEVDSESDTETAAAFCKKKRIQCALSAGNPFIGDLGTYTGPSWDMQNIGYLNNELSHRNINALFLWTLNWRGPYEDDMVRILLRGRDYWEYLAGSNWQCGQEGNGVIAGAVNGYYYKDFCSTVNEQDACTTADAEMVYGGWARRGTRYSNIGRPRNKYSKPTPSGYDC